MGQGTRPAGHLGAGSSGKLRIGLPLAIGIAVAVALVILQPPVQSFVVVRVTTCCPPFGISNEGEGHYAPGEVGCEPAPSVVCYFVGLFVSASGWQLSEFRFELLGPPVNPNNVLSGAAVPLGLGASVTVLDSGGKPVGNWNWSLSSWAFGGSWSIPSPSNLTLILDTGLQGVSFESDLFLIGASSLGGGGVGTYLR